MKLDEILRQYGIYQGGFGKSFTYVAEKGEDGCWRLVRHQVRYYGTGPADTGRITNIQSTSYIRQDYEIYEVKPKGTFVKDNKGEGWLSLLVDTGMTLDVMTGNASVTHEEFKGRTLPMPTKESDKDW